MGRKKKNQTGKQWILLAFDDEVANNAKPFLLFVLLNQQRGKTYVEKNMPVRYFWRLGKTDSEKHW